MIGRPARFIVSVAVLIAALLAGGSPASASRSEDGLVPGLPVYVALGDSIANGQQSADAVPGDYWATVAAWQANGYVAMFGTYLAQNLDCVPGRGPATGAACRQLQVLNLARSAVPPEVEPPDGRPGVTTQIVIDEQLPVAVPLLRARNQDNNPRNDVPVVTLTVGGNDVFGPIIAACVMASPPSAEGCSTAIQTAFTGFATNYTTILTQLRQAAGPDAELITMTYYNPLPYCALGANPAAGPFGDWVLEGGTLNGIELETGFNDLVDAISSQYQASVADTFGALGDGDFVGGADCLHPNADGHAKIATAFEAALAH
jgi:lysophospholipase L1-like esterase